MELRGFTRADAPGIRALLDKHGWGRDYIDGQVASISALSQSPSGFTAVYVDDRALAGFISVQFYEWNRLSQIHGLAVDPNRARHRIGSLLVRCGEDFARSRGARGVYLDTPVDNRVGRAFYVANGYTEVVMPKIAAVRRATGRDRDEWFALLDAWGAPGRPYRQISDWLTGEHDVSRWWAQKLIVEYEQERGLRRPGVRRDGTFEVSASKTVAVPVERLFDAFVDARRRKRWLTKGRMSLRSSEPGRSSRFAWDDGPTRVDVEFIDKGASKSTVVVAHARLTDADEAKKTKAMWRERLNELKSSLETSSS
jgi:ribosomal protein S18 acetylase RimI-like enzyme/uncharacterized protein YndB with AHSA1/START domain